MKIKHLFTYFGLTLAIATSTIIYSCQKEQTGIDKSENLTEQSLKDAQLEKRIISFRDKIDMIRKNPTLKSGTNPMEIDSAIWYIESTSNLTYGDASFNSEKFVIDSAFIEIPITNGQILWLDVQVAYDQVIDSLSEHNANITASEKQLIVADISLKESDNNTATFEVTSGFGSESINGSAFSDFGVDDFWKWGGSYTNDGGYCDGTYTGTELNSDAAVEIKQKINGRKLVPTGNHYYTNVSILTIEAVSVGFVSLDGNYCEDCSFLNPNDTIPYDNMYDYYIFSSSSVFPNHHNCLSPNEMNFYLDGMEDIIYTTAYQWYPYELENKEFIRVDIVGEALYSVTTTYFHIGTIKYGICHVSNNPPTEL